MDAGKFPVAEMIGNALPPVFAAAQGRAIKRALLRQTENAGP
jgi:hypothetical protein